jgi:6-phosphogluconolactonase
LRPEVRVSEDPAGAAADRLRSAAGHVVVTGGSTPRRAYEQVARDRPDWSGTSIWFTDERCVPPEHEHSNFRMVHEALVDRIEGAAVRRMQGELGPWEGAAAYERELHAAFGDELPALDFILLGMGPDVHTCSLFPGDGALGERERWTVGVETPGMAPLVSRITLTLPIVNAARSLVFLVTGEDKADAVARAVNGPPDPSAPASLVEPVSGSLELICDASAASRL